MQINNYNFEDQMTRVYHRILILSFLLVTSSENIHWRELAIFVHTFRSPDMLRATVVLNFCACTYSRFDESATGDGKLTGVTNYFYAYPL